MTLNELISGYTADGGKLSGDDLRAASRTAWRCLYDRTFGRVYSDDDHVELIQQCFDELVDAVHQRWHGGTLASQSVGSWSQSYADGSQTSDQIYADIIRQWLGDTGLLYRGWPG
mgnify:FL=1